MGNVDSLGVLDTSSLYIQSSTQYDSTGNYVASVTDQRGKTTYYDIDTTTGLTNSVTDANGNTVTYEYYDDNYLSHKVISGGEEVEYIYDDYNQLSSIEHNGFEYGFNYDEFGNTTSITVADRILVANTYADNNGYLEQKEYGNGTEYTYTYDKYGRVTSVAVNGTTNFNTVYNKKGQVAYVYEIANNRKLVYTYDISGRVLKMEYTGFATIATTYDEFDRPNGVTYTFAGQEKSVSFTYGEGGRKGTTVLLSGDEITTAYDDLSRETSTTIGTDFTREIAYINLSGNKTTTLPSSVTYTKNSVQIFNESYTYDNIGNIKTVTNNGVTVTYSYDDLNQLTRASGSDGTVTKYFYNDGGNINYKVNADGSKTHYVYDTEWKDLLVGFGGQTITYDEIGNPINYLGNTMSWTGRTLDSIVKADGTQISYTYDLDGIRTKKTVNGITTEYFVNGSTILAQKNGDDVIWFIYDVDGEILGFTYNDTPYYYVKNIQGDVVVIVTAGGVPAGAYTYDPWGKITSAVGAIAEINPIRYRGYYYDNETGLYYLNSRYYDPDTCRFINADAYVSTGQGLLGFNMFAYCLNNPVNGYDPTGGFVLATIIGVAVVTAVVALCVAVDNGNQKNAELDNSESTTTKNKIIDNQNAPIIGEFRYGLYSASYNSCEIIAVHNAKVLSGKDSTFSETALDFLAVGANLGFGVFGSDPHAIGRVLEKNGIDYSKVDLKEMTNPGVYIISYWNGPFPSSLHTVAISYDGSTYTTYNRKGGRTYDSPSEYATRFICGYYLG